MFTLENCSHFSHTKLVKMIDHSLERGILRKNHVWWQTNKRKPKRCDVPECTYASHKSAVVYGKQRMMEIESKNRPEKTQQRPVIIHSKRQEAVSGLFQSVNRHVLTAWKPRCERNVHRSERLKFSRERKASERKASWEKNTKSKVDIGETG